MAKGIIDMLEFGQKVGRQAKSHGGKSVTQNKAWSALLQSFATQAAPSQIQIGKGQELQSFNSSLPSSGLPRTKNTGSALPIKASSEKMPGEEAVQLPARSNDKLIKQASIQVATSNPESPLQVNSNPAVVTARLDAHPDKDTVLLDEVDPLVEPNRCIANPGVAQIYVASAASIDAKQKLVQTDEEPLTKALDLGKTRKNSTQSKQVATALVSAETTPLGAQNAHSANETSQKGLDLQPVKEAPDEYKGNSVLVRSVQGQIETQAPPDLVPKEKSPLARQILANQVQEIATTTGVGRIATEPKVEQFAPVSRIAQAASSQLQLISQVDRPQLYGQAGHQDEGPLAVTRHQLASELNLSSRDATSSKNTQPITGQLFRHVDAQPAKQPAATQASFAVEPGPLPVTGTFAPAAGLPMSQAGETSSAMQSDLVINPSPKSVAALSSEQLPLEGKALRIMGERGQIAPTLMATGEGNLVKRAPSTPVLPDVSQSATAVKPMTGVQSTSYLQQAIPLVVSTGRAIASASTATLTEINRAELIEIASGGVSKSHQVPVTAKSHKVMKATLEAEAASGKLVESLPAKDSRLVSEVRVEQETDSLSRLAFGEILQATGNQPKLPSSKIPVDAQSYVDWPQAEIQLADGVLRLINRGQPDSLTVVLDSPLGEVGLSVHRTEAGLHLMLSTGNDQARGLLEQGLGQLQNRLDQLGCGFVGAEVTADDKGRHTFGEQGRHHRPPSQFTDKAHNLPSELGLQADSLLDTFA